jgi:hypothetical protein
MVNVGINYRINGHQASAIGISITPLFMHLCLVILLAGQREWWMQAAGVHLLFMNSNVMNETISNPF